MDFTIQAASGIMSITDDPDGPPMQAGPVLVDFMGGIHLYAAVVTALLQRVANGQGQLVEVAMWEAVYPTLASGYDYTMRTGKVPPRAGNAKRNCRARRKTPSRPKTAGSPSASSPISIGKLCYGRSGVPNCRTIRASRPTSRVA
jgi:crotonobetainyl-CoA:carnitine CoA-transferase CaiB-like acyl-CoA transferase